MSTSRFNPINLSRREAVAGLTTLAASPAYAKTKKPVAATQNIPFDEISEKLLAHLRETACYNGTPGALRGGPLARSMNDYSPAGEAKLRAEFQAGRDLLAPIRIRGGGPMATYLATVAAILENGTRSATISYGNINPLNFTGHSPYTVSQISGPHIDTPNIMMEQQALDSPQAVDAWLEKLDGFDKGFAGVAEKVKADQAAGCVPPKALIDKTLPVLDEFITTKSSSHPLIIALNRRMAEAGLAKKTRAAAINRATMSLETRAKPAYQKLREAIAALQPIGRPEAGVWAQPQGSALYAANVRGLGDTSMSLDEIHELGMAEIGRITGAMNALLAKQGMKQGTIGARMTALAKDPANQFPDSDKGREALLNYVRSRVKATEARYGELLPAHLIPSQKLIVKRVPKATEASAPGGFYDGPSLDGSRPGIYWINLRDMKSVARFRLPTLSHHEGVPGHHTQGAIAAGLTDAPLLVRIGSFNAYQEGWALYCERMMAELGAYKDDPLGDLGRLQDDLFRAVRLVVDTGLHHKRWTREQAIRTMQDATGIAETRVVAEVERYMAWPGQALGYKLGQLRLISMREKFLKSGKGDLRTFNGAVLSGGAMPLDLVASRLGI